MKRAHSHKQGRCEDTQKGRKETEKVEIITKFWSEEWTNPLAKMDILWFS